MFNKLWVNALLVICTAVAARGQNNSRMATLTKLATNYDKLSHPGSVSNEVTNVHLEVCIESLSSFDETKMEYKADLYLRANWTDPRLRHTHSRAISSYHTELLTQFWSPDIYIANARSTEVQQVTIPNVHYKFHNNGTLWTSRRITTSLLCTMSLKNFPTDKQLCFIKFLMFTSTVDEVNVTWLHGNDSIQLSPDIKLNSFHIASVYGNYCDGVYKGVGNYSCLLANWELVRFAGFHFYHIFLPSVVVVSISWLTFWISPRAIPARVTLCITTFLTLTTQFSKSSSSMRVAYATAADRWITICSLFIYAALIEFTIAYHYYEKETTKIAVNVNNSRANEVENRNKVSEDEGGNGMMTIFQDILAKQKQQSGYLRVDKISRLLFPFAFLIVTIVFFLMYPMGDRYFE